MLYMGRGRRDPTNADLWQFKATRLVRAEDVMLFDPPQRVDFSVRSGWTVISRYSKDSVDALRRLRDNIKSIGALVVEVNQQLLRLQGDSNERHEPDA